MSVKAHNSIIAPSRCGTGPGNGSPTVNDVMGFSSMMAYYTFQFVK